MVDLTVVPDAVGPATSEPHCYIAPAEANDVMFEQLEWLLEHGNGTCATGCRECARLETVKRLLLQPFSSDPNVTPLRIPMLAA